MDEGTRSENRRVMRGESFFVCFALPLCAILSLDRNASPSRLLSPSSLLLIFSHVVSVVSLSRAHATHTF